MNTKNHKKEICYCDHCASVVPIKYVRRVAESPVDLHSVNAGESASLCEDCYTMVMFSLLP